MTDERSMRRRTFILFAALGPALAACGEAAEEPAPPPLLQQPASVDIQPVTFDTASITLHDDGRTVPLRVEVADRPDRRAYGLMDRDALDENAGMIFLYDEQQPPGSGFWMYRTRIPLDIAFFDGAGRIVAIMQMMPCTAFDAAQCPAYSPDVAYFGAIEANRGFFQRNNITIGDRVVMPGRIGG